MLDKNFSAKNPEQISLILDVVHDCWFDVDDILFHPDTSILSIKFKSEDTDRSRVIEKKWFIKKIEVPLVESLLKIHHVRNYSINDTENVGSYDFSDLEYDPVLKRIIIITGVPIEIQVFVETFEISVEVTDKVIGVNTRTSILH